MIENCLENVANIISALSAFGGVLIAFKGLRTWRREIESRLAVNLLSLLRETEEAQHMVRLPWTNEEEVRENALDPHQQRPTKVLMARWQVAVMRRKKVEIIIEEATLRWGEHVSSCWDQVEKTEFSLLNKIRLRDRSLTADDEEYLKLDAELSDDFSQFDSMRAEISKPFDELRKLIGRKL